MKIVTDQVSLSAGSVAIEKEPIAVSRGARGSGCVADR
jgi:hypothetical protein